MQAFATQKQAMQTKMSRMRRLQELALGIPDAAAEAKKEPLVGTGAAELAKPTAARKPSPEQARYANETPRVSVPRRPPRRELYWEILKDRLEDHMDNSGGPRSTSMPMARPPA